MTKPVDSMLRDILREHVEFSIRVSPKQDRADILNIAEIVGELSDKKNKTLILFCRADMADADKLMLQYPM